MPDENKPDLNPAGDGYNVGHSFSRLEIKQAAHIFEEGIIKYFGEVWQPKSDGAYRALDWYCGSPILFDGGVWRLCQAARHKGAIRAAGEIETKEAGTVLRFILIYAPVKEKLIHEQ